MQIIYEYHDVSASERLEGMVKEKLEKLEAKYDFVHRADVFFKKENRSDDQEMFCDVRLSMPGPRIFASSNADSFESAISETIRDLQDQLRKVKDKMSAH
ncbi:ribosome hibernation-promoting factor, HPF/YfiA family [Zobellia uliginosa]|uniref:ribosome hibernation-promoting factor, HPF/YfiA family n=1 Tax=Zobellia uliginosa TaxID=143224 RepID=UPI001C079138|nr:ribosome-associated translation inhibitor RaiA [Zobellia uliginosa]MBU2948863.1 ribosome-associated translation inhibitor RaiA [Zobellia uliginosa]